MAEPSQNQSEMRRRIFLVDDHPLVREWLGSLIERQPDLTVCGHAENSAAAFDCIQRLNPHLVILDLSLSSGSGLELIKQIQVLSAPPKILVLSMHEEAFYAERAIRAGADGYVMKRAATGRMIDAIRKVLEGKLVLSEQLAAQLAEKFVSGRTSPVESPVSSLSDREMEVFRELGRGKPTKEIAEAMHISPKTVQVYCARIKQKFALRDVNGLIREAVRWVEHEHRGS